MANFVNQIIPLKYVVNILSILANSSFTKCILDNTNSAKNITTYKA
jgi:hypothetical protein